MAPHLEVPLRRPSRSMRCPLRCHSSASWVPRCAPPWGPKAPPIEVLGEKLWEQHLQVQVVLGPYGQNELYHTPLLSKIWGLGVIIIFVGWCLLSFYLRYVNLVCPVCPLGVLMFWLNLKTPRKIVDINIAKSKQMIFLLHQQFTHSLQLYLLKWILDFHSNVCTKVPPSSIFGKSLIM